MMIKQLLLAASVLGAVVSAIDQCSGYPDCPSCMGTGNGTTSTRPFCGWCHSRVLFPGDGTYGGKCVDIRDKPFVCPNEAAYDIRQCTMGFTCNFTTGQCVQSKTTGEGTYGDKSKCESHCFVPKKEDKKFKCNVSDYTCNECPDDDQDNCSPKEEACKLCEEPPPADYFCNKTDPKKAQCQKCDDDTNASLCGSYEEKCKDCSSDDDDDKPQQPDKFHCNEETKTCEKTNETSGLPGLACNSSCSNSTPADLKKTVWRGIEAQQGFARGEVDIEFGEKEGTIAWQDGTILKGKVSTSFSGTTFEVTDGPQAEVGTKYSFNTRTLGAPPQTEVRAFLMSARGGKAPQSIKQAMSKPSGGKVLLMARCNQQTAGKSCDFSSVMDALAKLQASQPSYLQVKASEQAKATFLWGTTAKASAAKSDPCNEFTSCSTCIGATTSTGFKCGWCQGAEVKYDDPAMPTGLKCAGFSANGTAFPLTCPTRFQTVKCDGWSCDWNAQGGPQCKHKEEGGEFDSNETCVKKSNCKKPDDDKKPKKCNFTTRQCEECELGKDPDCNTDAHCDAVCSPDKKYSTCDFKEKKCKECTPKSENDANCSMSSEDCEKVCSASTYGICDIDTGKCDPCDPKEGKAGCVQGCSDSCQKKHNDTDQKDKANKFTCNWNTGTGVPKCDNSTKPQGGGGVSKEECEKTCKAPDMAKCNVSSGKCEKCQAGEPGCSLPMANCEASCKPTVSINGVWRGIQINKGFTVGEVDFDMSIAGKAKISFIRKGKNSKAEEYMADVSMDTPGAGGGDMLPITLDFQDAPDGSSNALDVKKGDKLKGVYKQMDGSSNMFKLLSIAVGKPGSNGAADFDEAMTRGLVFNLYSCKSDKGGADGGCDFSSVSYSGEWQLAGIE